MSSGLELTELSALPPDDGLLDDAAALAHSLSDPFVR